MPQPPPPSSYTPPMNTSYQAPAANTSYQPSHANTSYQPVNTNTSYQPAPASDYQDDAPNVSYQEAAPTSSYQAPPPSSYQAPPPTTATPYYPPAAKNTPYAPHAPHKQSKEELNMMPRKPSYMADNEDEWRLEMIKYLMFAYNIIIFFFSGTLLGVSIWMAVERSFMTHIIGNDWYAAAIYMGLCSGAIVFFVTALGFYGAFSESKRVIKIFVGVLAFVTVALLFTSLIAIVFRSQIGSSVKKSMSDTITKYYDVDLDKFFNRAVTNAWNKAQRKLHCCAVDDEGWVLYRDSEWFKKYGAYSDVMGLKYGHDVPKPYVPLSCCATDTYYTILNAEICQKWRLGAPGTLAPGAYNHALNYKGCFNMGKKYLKENMDIILGFGLTLMFFLIMGIVLSIALIKQIRVKKTAT